MNSIRRYLIVVLLAAVTLVNFVAALHGYQRSMAAADQLFDDKLREVATLLQQSLTGLHVVESGSMAAAMPGAPARLPADSDDAAIFQLWSAGKLLARSTDAPNIPLSPLKEGFHDVNFDRHRWRSLTRKLSYPESSGVAWLVVAEKIDSRFTLAESVIVQAVIPIVASLPLIGLIIWWVVGRGLKPLRALADQLREKSSDDFSPVEQPQKTVELVQLVNSVNNLLKRLAATYEREKRFASNAAHELRTPISVLKVHLYNLQQEMQGGSPSAAALQEGVERLEHLVEQILALHRNSQESLETQFSSLSLLELAKSSIGDCYNSIDEKSQTIELSGDQSADIVGEPNALRVLLNNIIGNASKYTPQKGRIRVGVVDEQTQARVVVEDSGPGIPEREYERVFERFYRVGGDRHSSGEEGCGLGLSIVKHIADLHTATIAMSCSLELGGLRVDICLPKSPGISR